MIAGLGISMPNYTTRFMERVPAAMRGRASGLPATAFFTGQFASPLVSARPVAWLGLAGTFAAVGGGLIALGVALWIGHARQPAPRAAEA